MKMKRKLVLSTGNKGKIAELKVILEDLNLDIRSKDEVGLMGLEVEETEDTLAGNAMLKAKAIWKECRGMVLADDTGLFVDQLDGEPGIYSARYAGEGSSDSDNRKKLLEKLSGTSSRSARFITAIAIIFEDGSSKVIEGVCEGEIAECEQGDRGFGYDSVFIPEGYDGTFAQLDASVKNDISHRARALSKLRELLEGVEG